MPEPIPDIRNDHQCYHYQAPSGQRCGSPALKGEYYCYHHMLKSAARANRRVLIDPEVTCMEIPPIEDRTSIFIALAAVVHRLAENTIDTRRAGQMIYGLQVAMRALEPPRGLRSQASTAAQPISEPQPVVDTADSTSTTGSASDPATQLATAPPRTIPITKESLLYFLRSRHCYNCNAELFPASELTERRNPGAAPEIIEEARPARPVPEAVILGEAPSLGEGAQSKDSETLHPATADRTFQPQPQRRLTLPTLNAVASDPISNPEPGTSNLAGCPLPLPPDFVDNRKGPAWPDRWSFRCKNQDLATGANKPCVAACQVGGTINPPYRQAACQPKWLATIGE